MAPSRKKKLSKEEIAELIERGYSDVFKWEDDDLALKSAANHSRLAHDKMSTQEMAAFSEIAENHISTTIFLHVRNKILQMWLLEPNVECTLESAYDQIMIPFNSDRGLIRRVHAYLERYGYINFGSYHQFTAAPAHTRKKIIVIGSGVSGMTAAKQLKRFGFDVTILEMRPRLGGRVHSHEGGKSGFKADLGAMVITGICGNPLVTLSRQFPCTLDRLNGSNCTVYDIRGKSIDKRKDQLVEDAFNRMGDIASYIVHERGFDTLDGEPIDLATAYDNILCLMEYRIQKKRMKFFQTYEEVVNTMKTIVEELNIYKKTVEEIGEKMKELEVTPLSEFNSKHEKEVLRRCYKRDLTNAFKKFDAMELRRRNVESFMSNLKRLEPKLSEVYMNNYDRRVLDFHLANLEYANGTRLRNLSLRHWDQDDENEIAGSHMTVREGMSHLVGKLVNTSDVLTLRRVTNIEYREEGVVVHANHITENGVILEEEEYKGDAVLCTLPLGILKRTAKGDKCGPVFDPPLPERKLQAIDKVGFGNLNKVVLIFDKIFWDDSMHFFGSTSADESCRGELYMFVAQSGKPVLIGLLAGSAANIAMDVDIRDEERIKKEKELIVHRAMELLSRVFGSVCPTAPAEAVVTMWHKDEAVLGCYSYMAKYSEASDYDILAESVRCMDEKGEYTGSEKLFFAGEHTNKNYPATVHGAMLSGMREAGRIADLFTGCPYALPQNNVILIDDDDDEDIQISNERGRREKETMVAEESSGSGRGDDIVMDEEDNMRNGRHSSALSLDDNNDDRMDM
ncbi:spr-5 [Pristionchus pacificus]|nr:spr-5 [Pristionchus pacificus]